MSTTPRTNCWQSNWDDTPEVLDAAKVMREIESDLNEALAALHWVNAGVVRDDPRMWCEVSRICKKHPQP